MEVPPPPPPPPANNIYRLNTKCKLYYHGGELSKQIVDIPMGTNCAPLLDNLFLYFYQNEVFLDNSSRRAKESLLESSISVIDNLISFNNKRFKEFISDIYLKEFTISKITEFISVASYVVDLPFTIDKNKNITTKLCDTR